MLQFDVYESPSKSSQKAYPYIVAKHKPLPF
ncbi:MAG: hypothetical protein ACJA0N_000073 [Pseudohongiellaceae bacterium]|jgi:hypothetical protein